MEANVRSTPYRGNPGDAADLQAVSETLRGNREAFRSIVERHGPLILRLASSFLRDPQEAEEASQEIFFKAFRSLRSFDLEKTFLPWLYALAMNYLRTRYRRNRRRTERIAAASREVPSDAGLGDPAAAVEAAQERERLRQAIASLPAGVRDVVSLYYVGGLSVTRIAESMGIGSENVKSRLHRGRKGIREFLDRNATPREDGGYTL